jgi:hypothetical protein
MKVTSATVVTLTMSASFVVLAVGAGTSGARTMPIDYPSPVSTQPGYVMEYGSPELIQLGHGPGGPSQAPLDV